MSKKKQHNFALIVPWFACLPCEWQWSIPCIWNWARRAHSQSTIQWPHWTSLRVRNMEKEAPSVWSTTLMFHKLKIRWEPSPQHTTAKSVWLLDCLGTKKHVAYRWWIHDFMVDIPQCMNGMSNVLSPKIVQWIVFFAATKNPKNILTRDGFTVEYCHCMRS